MKKMKENGENMNLPSRQVGKENTLPGYPNYPTSEDIYSKYMEEKNITPKGISNIKESNENDKDGNRNEIKSNNSLSGSDFAIPGSELDA